MAEIKLFGARVKATMAVGVLLSGLLVSVWAAPASATGRAGFSLLSVRSGRCVDADLNTIGRNGTKVQLWACNGSRQQKWTFISGAVRGSFRVISQYNGRCLDADLNTIRGNGTKMQLWDCNAQAQQDWRTR